MSEIIELTDTARLRIETDEGARNKCPRGDWHMATGFVKIEGKGDSRLMDVPEVYDPPAPIADAHHRLRLPREDHHGRHWYQDDPDLVARWARIFHGLVLEYDAEHGGYWFVGDPTERTTPEHQAEVIAQEQETYRQWAAGEVYGVILERTAKWVQVERAGQAVDDPAERIEWDEAESLWDCYLSDSYTAQVVAREHFDLTPEEEAAL